MTKPVTFLGSSLDDLRTFPWQARREAGFQLDKVQHGDPPDDWKSLPELGAGICEIRIRDVSGIYRVMYAARFPEAVYVFHVFQKKMQATPKRDLDLVRRRYNELLRNRA